MPCPSKVCDTGLSAAPAARDTARLLLPPLLLALSAVPVLRGRVTLGGVAVTLMVGVDELGVPFAITVDFDSLKDETVTLRERDSTAQVRLPAAECAGVLSALSSGASSWEEMAGKYPQVEAKA